MPFRAPAADAAPPGQLMFQTADQHLVDAVAVHLHYLHPPALDAHPLAFVRDMPQGLQQQPRQCTHASNSHAKRVFSFGLSSIML